MKAIIIIFLLNFNLSYAQTENPNLDDLYKVLTENKAKSKMFFNSLLQQYYKKDDPNFTNTFERLVSKIIFTNDKNSQFYGNFVEGLTIHEAKKGSRYKNIISNIISEFVKYQNTKQKNIWTNGHRVLLINSILNRFQVPKQILLLPFDYSTSIEANSKFLNTKDLNLFGLRLLDMLREDKLLEEYLVKKSSKIENKCRVNIIKGRLLLRKGIFNSAQKIFNRNINSSKKSCLMFSKYLESYSSLLQNKTQESRKIIMEISQIKTNNDSENELKKFFIKLGNFYIEFKEGNTEKINSSFNEFTKIINEEKNFQPYDIILTTYLAYAIKLNDKSILDRSLSYYKKAIQSLINTQIAKDEITPFFELAKLKMSGKDITSKKKIISDRLKNTFGKGNKSAFLISNL